MSENNASSSFVKEEQRRILYRRNPKTGIKVICINNSLIPGGILYFNILPLDNNSSKIKKRISLAEGKLFEAAPGSDNNYTGSFISCCVLNCYSDGDRYLTRAENTGNHHDRLTYPSARTKPAVCFSKSSRTPGRGIPYQRSGSASSGPELCTATAGMRRNAALYMGDRSGKSASRFNHGKQRMGYRDTHRHRILYFYGDGYRFNR